MTAKEAKAGHALGTQSNGLRAGRWQVRPEESHVGFRVRKMGLYFVKGRFRRVEGHVDFDPQGIAARGEVVVDAKSVFTRIPLRDWHLRTNDFLGARRQPHIRVTATEVAPRTDGDLQVQARLAIRDTERDVSLRAHLHQGDRPNRIGLDLQGRIDRRDFGVRARIPFEWVVGREVELDVRLELERTGSVS